VPLPNTERAKAVSPVLADFRESAKLRGYNPLLTDAMVTIEPVERQMPPPSFASPEEEAEPAEPIRVRVFGFASRPEIHKLNRNQIYFFVNRRLVRDRLILHAIPKPIAISSSGISPVAVFQNSGGGSRECPPRKPVRFRRRNSFTTWCATRSSVAGRGTTGACFRHRNLPRLALAADAATFRIGRQT
jgi:hypothetical protein